MTESVAPESSLEPPMSPFRQKLHEDYLARIATLDENGTPRLDAVKADQLYRRPSVEADAPVRPRDGDFT